MRVLYDGVAFQNAHQRGIQRVFRETWRRLPADVRAVVALSGPLRAELSANVETVRVGVPLARLLPRGARRALHGRRGVPGMARLASSCDVFHPTYYAPPPPGIRAVVSVHDMIVERYVDLFQGKWVEEEIARKRAAIEGAARIIAISHATAREVVRFFPRVRDLVTVVHLAADLPSPETGTSLANRADAYALYVGDRGLYKNFGAVLDAMEGDWPSHIGLTVVGAPWKANEAFRVERLGATRRIRLAGRVSDGELAALYRGAACVVVPSIVEGFGLPLLEAQRAGAPLVCSDTEVFREVAGEGALFFDPHRPEQIAERVTEAADTGIRERLVSQGAKNIAKFSWERCAAETVEVYRAAMGT